MGRAMDRSLGREVPSGVQQKGGSFLWLPGPAHPKHTGQVLIWCCFPEEAGPGLGMDPPRHSFPMLVLGEQDLPWTGQERLESLLRGPRGCMRLCVSVFWCLFLQVSVFQHHPCYGEGRGEHCSLTPSPPWLHSLLGILQVVASRQDDQGPHPWEDRVPSEMWGG